MFAWELIVVVLLIVLNGFFAMSELAVVSARRARLQQMAEDGNREPGRRCAWWKTPASSCPRSRSA